MQDRTTTIPGIQAEPWTVQILHAAKSCIGVDMETFRGGL